MPVFYILFDLEMPTMSVIDSTANITRDVQTYRILHLTCDSEGIFHLEKLLCIWIPSSRLRPCQRPLLCRNVTTTAKDSLSSWCAFQPETCVRRAHLPRRIPTQTFPKYLLKEIREQSIPGRSFKSFCGDHVGICGGGRIPSDVMKSILLQPVDPCDD